MAAGDEGALAVPSLEADELAKLPSLIQDKDVRRTQAPLNPSPFDWVPVWNRTSHTAYAYNVERDEVRLNPVDTPGRYRITHTGPTAVSSKVNRLEAGDVATLWQHTGVEVLAVVHRPELQRVRARIKSPPGWITLVDTRTNYRWAARADVVILVSGATGTPEINGRYEHDSNEERDGGVYPRYRQVNGSHFLRLAHSQAPVWMITRIREGPPVQAIRCESGYWRERRPVTLDLLPPTSPALWGQPSSGEGMEEPMPQLTILHAHEGTTRKNPEGRTHPLLGVLTLDYGYPTSAEQVYSSASTGYDVLYRVVPRMTFERASEGVFTEDLQRQVLGAVQRLLQLGAHAITADCNFMLAFRGKISEMSPRPIFMSPLLQWIALSFLHAKEDKFLIMTGDEAKLKQQAGLLKKVVGLDLGDDRFVVVHCGDIPNLFTVTRAEGIPKESIEAAAVASAMSALQGQQGVRGILVESSDLLPYTDGIRAATGLPVWDGVTGAELFGTMRLDYFRFEVHDWLNEVLFEHGVQEGRPESCTRPRILGVIGLDYENAAVDTEYAVQGTRGFQVRHKSIKDLTRYLTSLGKLTKACEKELREVIRWMEEDIGVCAITGDCAFMMSYQLLVRDAVRVPVFLSPLMFCRVLAEMLPEGQRVLIMTAGRPEFEEQRKLLMSHCGFDLNSRRYMIMGCEDVEGLTKLAKKGEMGTQEVIQVAICSRICVALDEWPTVGIHVGAVVLESPQLMPYSPAIRQTLQGRIPVLDAVTCAEYLVAARQENERFGIKHWPYLWDGSVDAD